MKKLTWLFFVIFTGSFTLGAVVQAEEQAMSTTSTPVVSKVQKKAKKHKAAKVSISKMQSPSETVKTADSKDGAKADHSKGYICPMCHITGDKPGKCPMCGMDMVKNTEKDSPKKE